ncbi:Serine protease 33 [Operophtera brumata]|uniref:Serine protease 33 n=1 Tax=Operophtera brumata TaxID=104452 RepID=A0A0L7LGT4_OPEBR|nr:Serine protease 33 [Operophtera brumata]
MSIFFEHVDRSARIVGGTEAFAGSHPHMVAMTNGLLVRSFLCGGSVISTRHVLTAAHCIDAVFSWGSLSSYAISRNVTHENYVSAIIKNDIGLLVTASDIQLSQLVSPIPLSYDYVGADAGGAISATLLEISTATIGGEQCVADAAQSSIVLNMRAPAWTSSTDDDANLLIPQGDSGSALVRTDRRQQIGVVSWGFPCALGAPDMFARHADPNARIVGGTEAPAGSHPHMVALTNGLLIRSFFCGGSLISQRTVLTAAHCIASTYSVTRNVTHQHYVSATIKNDIGVLITSANVALSALVHPIPLTYEEIPGGVPTRANGALSATLLELRASTLSGADCVSRVALAAVELNTRAPPIGVVSWGFPCARGAPDMFARVSGFEAWLQQHVV